MKEVNQDLTKLDITEKYFRNINTGVIIPVYKKELSEQVELDNQKLIKNRKKDFIEFEVISRKELLSMIEDNVENDSVGDNEIKSANTKKPGRKRINY